MKTNTFEHQEPQLLYTSGQPSKYVLRVAIGGATLNIAMDHRYAPDR